MSPASGPTRVALAITDLDPGGAERAFVRLVTGLDRNRWQPSAFCLSRPGALVSELEGAGIPITCLGARSWRDVGVVFRLARALRQARPELLQTFLFHSNIAGRIAARLARVPHVVSGIRVAERRRRGHLWIDRRTNRMVDCNVCVSQAVADFSVQRGGLDPARIVVIPNGVDAARFATAEPADLAQWGITPEHKTLIFIGRLDPQKGLRVLLPALERLALTFSKVRLLIVGEGPERKEIEAWITAHKLAEVVHVLGRRDDVPELLAAAQCLVLPSLWEGMPNVVLEAMAAGLPVVASRVEGVTELVRHEETGLLVSPGDVEELSGALHRVISEGKRAMLWGAMGKERVQAGFTWEGMIHQYSQLYTRLLEGDP